jgi:hypothetical protein
MSREVVTGYGLEQLVNLNLDAISRGQLPDLRTTAVHHLRDILVKSRYLQRD